MGCNCRKNRSLEYIRNLAKVFADVTKQEIQIYSYLINNKTLYNFEPINKQRTNIIEYINP